jgi:signal transduction histidine kinase
MKEIFQKKYILSTLFVLLMSSIVFADEIVVHFNSEQTAHSIGKQIYIYNDETNSLTAQQVYRLNIWRKSVKEVPNLGISNNTVWVKCHIRNDSKESELTLALNQPILNNVICYEIDDQGNAIDSSVSGESHPYSQRDIMRPDPTFRTNIPIGETKTYLLKINSIATLQLALSVATPAERMDQDRTKGLLLGIYYGIILIMLLYNFFIYFTVKDKVYMYYVVYMFSLFLIQVTLEGYGFAYFWPNVTWLSENSFFIFTALVNITGVEFVKQFLHTKENLPRLGRASFIIYTFQVIFIILSIAGFRLITYQIMQGVAGVTAIYMLIMGIVAFNNGYQPAKFFLFAWSFLVVGIVIYVLKDMGIISHSNFSNYGLAIGTVLEVTLLSLALADKIRILREENEQNQQAKLLALKEKQDLIEQQNTMLESKVNERTYDLQKANYSLKMAQVQLVNSEKMATIGQLTAGIAHEINNPINFVSSNVKPLKRDIDDLVAIINKYQEIVASGDDINIKLKEAEEFAKYMDTPFLIDEMNMLIKGIDDGAYRTGEIIKGLRNFSRLDEAEMKKADLADGIRNTLVLLNNQIKDQIEVKLNLEEAPQIMCYPGKLNQVFMNILSNSLHAIDARANKTEAGCVEITLKNLPDVISITIKDNGIGMNEEVKKKIFEPFFTTKEVGEGTGLGMSIVYTIIENHSGSISVESEEGKGASFIIEIPKGLWAYAEKQEIVANSEVNLT